MKKLLFLLFLLPALSFSDSNTVYICTGKYAKAYHKSTDCRGMKACKGETKTVTLEQAQKMGRTPCGYCY